MRLWQRNWRLRLPVGRNEEALEIAGSRLRKDLYRRRDGQRKTFGEILAARHRLALTSIPPPVVRATVLISLA